MLAKLTTKNQLTLPKSVVTALPHSDYFEIEVRSGQLVLTPVRIQRADAVRAKLAELQKRTSLTASARLAWFILIAALRDWRLADPDQSDVSTS